MCPIYPHNSTYHHQIAGETKLSYPRYLSFYIHLCNKAVHTNCFWARIGLSLTRPLFFLYLQDCVNRLVWTTVTPANFLFLPNFFRLLLLELHFSVAISLQANYTDRLPWPATLMSTFLRVEGLARSAQRVPTAVELDF
jgi:hypothetical protein